MTYSKQTWVDGSGLYPVSAVRMGVIEQGIYDAHYRPFCRLRHSATFAVPSAAVGTAFSISHSWDTEDADPFGMHDTVTNNSRVILPARGLYAAIFSAGLASTGVASYQGLRIVANSGDALTWTPAFPVIAVTVWGAAQSVDMATMVSGTFYCTNPGTDYLQAQISQNSGANRNCAASQGSAPSTFSVWLVSWA